MTSETEFARVRWELKQLQEKVAEDEIAYSLLKDRLDQLEERVRMGKGVVIGFLISLGSIGILSFDKLRLLVSRLIE